MRKALVTISVGSHQEIHAVTGARMAEYAAMIDAEYVVITETSRQPAHFAKFDMLATMVDQGFEQILYVDADIYIRQQAPDILQAYNSAAFSEVPHPRPAWITKSVNWIRANISPDWPATRYFNTGVLVIGGNELLSLAALVRNVEQRPGIYYEQDQLNVLMRDANYPQQRLDQRWNQFCSNEWVSPAKAAAAYFLHGTGVVADQKLQLINMFVKEYP